MFQSEQTAMIGVDTVYRGCCVLIRLSGGAASHMLMGQNLSRSAPQTIPGKVGPKSPGRDFAPRKMVDVDSEFRGDNPAVLGLPDRILRVATTLPSKLLLGTSKPDSAFDEV